MSSDNDVIAGEVVQTDDDMATDEDQAQAPETYFHKVAGPQRSYTYPPADAADEQPVAVDPATTDPDLPVALDELDDTDDLDDSGTPVTVTEPVNVTEADDELDDVTEPVNVTEPVADELVVDEAVTVDEADEDDEPVAEAVLVETAPPVEPSVTPVSTATTVSTTPESLLGDTSVLMQEWRQAAAQFVDDPQAAAGQAADVVAEAVTMLETAVRDLRASWDGGGNGQPDTEALRQTVLGYRRILDKLVS
jgi:hypothetical protein